MIDVRLPPMKHGDPTWYMALGYPRQGDWTESAFLALDKKDNNLRELSNGYLEMLPVPSALHQRILRFLLYSFEAYLQATSIGGELLFAPLPTRILPGTIREPDLLYLSPEQSAATEKYPTSVDMVLEIVSGSKADRQRDFVTKRKEYAKAGILEYWIVDPKTTTIHVLTLNQATQRYKLHGKYTSGQVASSKLFKGFKVTVSDVFKKR